MSAHSNVMTSGIRVKRRRHCVAEAVNRTYDAFHIRSNVFLYGMYEAFSISKVS
jgi:hypothetical protein